jgi:hypothetical protein
LKVRIIWRTQGSAGNSKTFTESLSNATADGAGTLGGTRAGYDGKVTIEWGTKGTAGNSIVFTEAMANTTADGSGTLGGTRAGQNAGSDTYTFDPDRYFDFRQLTISRSGVRNVIRVKYGVKQNDRTTIEVSDSGSITKYGRRFMEVAEAGSSQIDTEGEARSMAEAILEDLKDPEATLQVESPYFWPVETGNDYYTYAANDYHFDTAQSLGVIGYQHSLTANRSRTTLTLRGKPSGGFKRWLELEARPGVASQNDFYNDDAAEGVASEANVASIIVTYDDPRGMSPPIDDWAFTKCHVSVTTGFTPSDSTLVGVGRQTRFEIGGLVPGTTYYIKLQMIDSSGNVAATSTQVAQATQKVGPYHINEDREYGVLIPNQDFGVSTLDSTTNMPDFWTIKSSHVYGSGEDVYVNTSIHNTGNRSLEFVKRESGDPTRIIDVWTDFIPVSQDSLYGVETSTRRSTDTISTTPLHMAWIQYYEEDKTTVVGSGTTYFSISVSTISTTAWTRTIAKGIEPPTNARYARVAIRCSDAQENFTLYVDQARMFRFLPSAEATDTTGQALIAGSTWTTYTANTKVYDYGTNYNTSTYTFTAPSDGIYAATFHCEVDNLSSGKFMQVCFYINITTRITSHRQLQTTTTGEVIHHTAPVIELSSGDTVKAQFYHDDTTADITTDSYWNVKQLSDT